jgi:hypothetical protein
LDKSDAEYTNYGSRIDCYAWGENIVTLSYDGTDKFQSYTQGFGMTSGASAIIAGAALALQGIAAAKDYRLSPSQMRSLLSDDGTLNSGGLGTPSVNPSVDKIGVMPNLQAIIPVVQNLAPDLCIRDSVTDTGATPYTGPLASSPDIILRPSRVAGDPNTAYGEGSGTENRDDLGVDPVVGQDHYIYVRVHNLGPTYAQNVTATVYWSPPATLVTPNLWTRVGTPAIIRDAPSGKISVSDAITWAASEIPAPGHYCFVALVGNRADPTPDPVNFLNMDDFSSFVRDNNNVAWRNFNVVNSDQDVMELAFFITGPPDQARSMRLEVIGNLPPQAQVTLQSAMQHREFIQQLGTTEEDDAQQVVRMHIVPNGCANTGDILFPARLQADARFLVRIPEELRRHQYELCVRQLYGGLEVGRITWRFVPPDRA